jgi:hypothetical protein
MSILSKLFLFFSSGILSLSEGRFFSQSGIEASANGATRAVAASDSNATCRSRSNA